MNKLKFSPREIESVAISALRPYERNPRTHSKDQLAKLAASMREFGWTVPILVDDNNEIIAGHGRVMAATEIGLQDVPVIRMRHLAPEQVQALRIADNQLTVLGDWDLGLLSFETQALGEAGFDLDLLGLDNAMLARLLTTNEQGLTDPDDIPDVADSAISAPGDLWALGNHRLLCGDSTNQSDVSKLFAGVQPSLMVTDPPYGVAYDPTSRRSLQSINSMPSIGIVTNDTRSDWSESYDLFTGDVAYIWHAVIFANTVADSIIASGFEIRTQIIWAKSKLVVGRGHYHVQHEPCYYAVRKGKTASWVGDRKQTTLWKIDKPMKSETGHSTQKPVECMQRPITNNSSPGQAVYDPFVGSGTTIIAAQITGRCCYAIEIAPQYCDVAVRRWQDFTGEKAILEGDGRSFDEIAKERTAARTASRAAAEPTQRL